MAKLNIQRVRNCQIECDKCKFKGSICNCLKYRDQLHQQLSVGIYRMAALKISENSQESTH